MKTLTLSLLSLFLFVSCSSPLDDPSTSIQFAIPSQSHVKLTIENSYNTVVDVLVNRELPAGVHQVVFDGSDLAEGIYFYIIEVTKEETGYYYKSKRTLLLIK